MSTYIGIPFGHDNHIIVEDSHGSMNAKFRSRSVDPIGFAAGNTVPKAARALVASVRRTADEMEAAIDKWEQCLKLQTDGLKTATPERSRSQDSKDSCQFPKDFCQLMKELGVPEITGKDRDDVLKAFRVGEGV